MAGRTQTRPARLLAALSLAGDRRGVAALEFALVAPLLLSLYFVTMEVAQAIETNKKVSRAASMVADLVTQQQTITKSELEAIMTIGVSTIQPYNRSQLSIAVTAIVIQRRSGGNLSEILTNVTETILERVKLKRDIAVLTTQQRLGSYVAACLPILVALAFTLLQPEMGRLLVTTTAGLIALSIGLACEVAGILLIRALAQIDP